MLSALFTAAFASICAVKLSALRLPANQVWQMKWLHKVNTHTQTHRAVRVQTTCQRNWQHKKLAQKPNKKLSTIRKGAGKKGDKCRESGAERVCGGEGLLKTWQRFTSGKPKEYYKQQQRQPQQQNAKTEAKRSKKGKREQHHTTPHRIASCPTMLHSAAPHRKCMPAKWQWQHFRFRPCRRHRTVGKTLSKLKGSADRRTET